MKKLESLKVFAADGIAINKLLATTRELKSWQASFWSLSMPRKSREISCASLPHSLASLSLADCNLFDDVFPRDFSGLSLLKNVNLSKNPIHRLPDCIRGLTGLQTLQLESFTRLKWLVGLPSVKKLIVSECTSLEKITFQSLLPNSEVSLRQCYKLVEFQSSFKIEPIEEVDREMINILGFPDLASVENIEMEFANGTLGLFHTKTCPIQVLTRLFHTKTCPIMVFTLSLSLPPSLVQELNVMISMAQAVHEFGLFNTFFSWKRGSKLVQP